MIEVRRSCYSRQGTRIYPGSAPLSRGKDLLPASVLLLLLDLDYKVPTPLIQESATSKLEEPEPSNRDQA